jgi:ATP-dependent HslUV protease, peptidase subunit HslV
MCSGEEMQGPHFERLYTQRKALKREQLANRGATCEARSPPCYNPPPMDTFSSTTVLLVRRNGKVCMGADGQVTMNNNTIVKSSAKKIRRAGKGKVLVGFAGGTADAIALFTRLEAKLEEFSGNLERAVVELAKDWRTDRALRQLQAVMIATDQDKSFFVSGAGELLQPDDDDGMFAVGSGANYALSAARALRRFTDLSAADIVRSAMKIAAEICVFTNDHLIIEEL